MITREIVNEWLKCEKDFYYFSETYLGRNFEKFKLTDNRFKLFVTARQEGKSTFAVAYALWKSLFTNDCTILFTTINLVSAAESKCVYSTFLNTFKNTILSKVIEVIDDSAREIRFDNGSRVLFTSGRNSGRGMIVNLVICDEAAYHNDFSEFVTYIYPCVAAAKGEIMVLTTPSADLANMERINTLTGFDRVIIKSSLTREKLDHIKSHIGKDNYNIEYLGA